VQRCLSMVAKHCDGVLPAPAALTGADQALFAQATELVAKSRDAIEDYALHTILADIWRVIGEANRYFASEEPWVKRKSDFARMQTILYVTADVARIIAILMQPFMPSSMEKLLSLLGVPPNARNFADAEVTQGLVSGVLLPPPVPIFPRYVEAGEAPAQGSSPC
jgi:methionyl-tRNA synthetase